jgi:hypothetical protein
LAVACTIFIRWAAHDAALQESRGKRLPYLKRLVREWRGVDHRRVGDRLDRPVGVGLHSLVKRDAQDDRDSTRGNAHRFFSFDSQVASGSVGMCVPEVGGVFRMPRGTGRTAAHRIRVQRGSGGRCVRINYSMSNLSWQRVRSPRCRVEIRPGRPKMEIPAIMLGQTDRTCFPERTTCVEPYCVLLRVCC